MNAAVVLDEADHLPVTVDTALDSSLAIGMSRVEIDQQIVTARRYPRQISVVAKNILSTVTLDEETAAECMYALPRGGKPIQGPSIRFAEAVKAFYGNNRSASRVVHVDRAEKVVVAEGIFHDLETNTATRSEVRRRIVDSKGRLYSDDMIIVTGNAAGSIALRNSILGGVPKAVWRRAYEEVLRTIAGDVTTLSVTREKAVAAFANYGATPEQVFGAIGVAGIEDVKLEHIPVLRGMFSALKNAEATVEEMFAPPTTRGLATTGMKARLEERSGAGKEAAGFNPEHIARETDAAKTPAEILGDDQVPNFDKTAVDGAATDRGEQAEDTKPGVTIGGVEMASLSDHIDAFKKACSDTTTKRMSEIWRSDIVKELLAAIEKADPDLVGTAEELESWFNDAFAAREDAEKAAKQGGAQ